MKKKCLSFDLLGCTAKEFRFYIEGKFKPGMTWGNREEWHIDHILPLAAFDLTDESKQRECFHYSNLQPLWKHENLAKGDKIIYMQTA